MSTPDQSMTATAEPAEPPRRSPWSIKARVVRSCWGVVEMVLWRLSPARAWGFRRILLRCFGARVGDGVRIHPSVKVVIPWNLVIADRVVVHERAILYALGKITIGDDSEIGPLCHICAGTHDYTDPKFTLLCQPITIGAGCVLHAASFVAPNISLADRTVLMPRAAIYADTQEGGVYLGNPARAVGDGPAGSKGQGDG